MRYQTATWLGCLALAGAAAFSCSVFPDEATLPSLVAAAGAGATGGDGPNDGVPQAGAGGVDGSESTAGAGAGSSAGEGGTLSLGGAPPIGAGGSEPLGGAGSTSVGACADPQSVTEAVTADTWIEAAAPKANHGGDTSLSVISGGQPRRALLQLALPTIPTGAVVLQAALALHLEANADIRLLERQLTVHQLAHEVIEGRATWENWSNGNRAWATAGGDFGPVLARAKLAAGSAGGSVTFDITEAVVASLAGSAASLPLIVLESSAPPPAPAELSFAAKGGNAASPTLVLRYCEP